MWNDNLTYKLRYILSLLLWGWGLTACTDELSGDETGPEISPRVDVTLQFTVGATASRGTEAVAPEYSWGTTALENQMRSITVLIETLDEEGKQLTDRKFDQQTLYLPENATSYTTTMKLKTTLGKKHIYIGANMNQAHVEAFIKDNTLTSTETDAKKILESVMTINENNTGQDILMFGQATQTLSEVDAPSKVIELTATNVEQPVDLGEVKLVRVVAKVLLTVPVNDFGVEITDYVSGEENQGFCELGNIYYMPDMTNKKVYIQGIINTEGEYIEDPNYSIEDFISYDATNGVFLLKDRDAYEGNFMHHDANTLMAITGDDFTPFNNATLKQHPSKFDRGRIGENAANHYTEGIYCLENLVSVPTTFFGNTGKSNDDVAELVSTYLLIALRYIPKSIIVDETLQKKTFKEVNQALEKLPAIEESGEILYPKGTYWMYKDDSNAAYYNYEAMKKSGIEESKFQPFIGGYSYYTTYIDGEVEYNKITYNQENKTHWGIERNHYYILNVTDITAPGSAVIDNPMRINSISIPWNDRGSTEVEIKP